MCFSVFSFAALVGPPIGGALIHDDKYTYAQIWAGLTALIGTSLVIAARVYRFGWSLKVRCWGMTCANLDSKWFMTYYSTVYKANLWFNSNFIFNTLDSPSTEVMRVCVSNERSSKKVFLWLEQDGTEMIPTRSVCLGMEQTFDITNCHDSNVKCLWVLYVKH